MQHMIPSYRYSVSLLFIIPCPVPICTSSGLRMGTGRRFVSKTIYENAAFLSDGAIRGVIMLGNVSVYIPEEYRKDETDESTGWTIE